MTYEIKPIRTEGEYPFYPVKAEHEVIRQLPAMEVFDDETGVKRLVIDYSGGVSKSFQCCFKV